MIYGHGFMRLVPSSLNSCWINKLFIFLPFLLTEFVFLQNNASANRLLNAKFKMGASRYRVEIASQGIFLN